MPLHFCLKCPHSVIFSVKSFQPTFPPQNSPFLVRSLCPYSVIPTLVHSLAISSVCVLSSRRWDLQGQSDDLVFVGPSAAPRKCSTNICWIKIMSSLSYAKEPSMNQCPLSLLFSWRHFGFIWLMACGWAASEQAGTLTSFTNAHMCQALC